MQSISNWETFALGVSMMREAQKEYFRTKSPTQLNVAKKHEAIIDKALRDHEDRLARRGQPELFAKEGNNGTERAE